MVTIIADASFCPASKAAGWAAWIKADGRDSALIWGTFTRIAPASSGEAEFFAVANALFKAAKDRFVGPRDRVMIQSDCVAVLETLLWGLDCRESQHPDGCELRRPRNRPGLARGAGERALTTIGGIAASLDLELFVRHVRGHVPGGGRQWVNRACDRAARQAMESVRRQRAPLADPAPRIDAGSVAQSAQARRRARQKARRKAGKAQAGGNVQNEGLGSENKRHGRSGDHRGAGD
jgi:ribonuclease HI